MRTIQFTAVLIVLIFTVSSCVENSEKFKSIVAQRDSLQLQAQAIESNYNETIGILNEVEEGFAQIRNAEGKMLKEVQGIEGTSTSRKEQLALQLAQVKEMLEQNKNKIDQLQRQSQQRGKENSTLSQSIKRLQTELEEKTAFIVSLQEELEKKNIRINELSTTVGQLSSDLNQLSEVSDKQQQQIKNQDVDMNTVWYVMGTSSELKTSQILSTNGIFRPSTVLDKAFDQSLFTKVDKRTIKLIPTGSKRVKVLTSHPKESYQLLKADDETVTVEILDQSLFWSVSKYLVIQK